MGHIDDQSSSRSMGSVVLLAESACGDGWKERRKCNDMIVIRHRHRWYHDGGAMYAGRWMNTVVLHR